MYVVDVIPFAPGAPGGSLSYRSGEKLPIGSIVTVALRRKKVTGVVVGIEEAQDVKATLKAASYSLSGTISKPVGRVPEALINAVANTAVWHAAAPGSVLHQLLSEWIGTEPGSLSNALVGGPGTGFGIDTVECPLADRNARYRKMISENRKNSKATLVVVSTLAEVEYWKKSFVDFSPVVLTGILKDGKREEAIKNARTAPLVISTPHFAFAQMSDLNTIIIERIGAGGFRLPKRPYLDIRIALLELARARKLDIVYGDYPLPLEYRSGSGESAGKSEPMEIIDVRADREEGDAWSAISASLRIRISEELEQGGRVAVFAARKGYAPVVVCGDCGQALKDERGKVFAYTQEGGKRLFRTSDGKSELSTERNCPNCDSWNLRPLGVGVERVAEELRELFSDAPQVLFDADTVRTAVGAKRRLAPLAESGSIAIGTEAMAPWLLAASPAPITLAVIASADTLLALPFWRARERFLRLGYLLSSIAPHAIVATRLPEDTAVKTLKDPSNPVFFEEETSLRAALGYPPFGTLISLSWQGRQGSEGALNTLEKEVRDAVSPHLTRAVPDRFVRGTSFQRTIVLLLPKEAWPDTGLSARLASLPPSVRVLVDPESFW